jgi:hypothetical protein
MSTGTKGNPDPPRDINLPCELARLAGELAHEAVKRPDRLHEASARVVEAIGAVLVTARSTDKGDDAVKVLDACSAALFRLVGGAPSLPQQTKAGAPTVGIQGRAVRDMLTAMRAEEGPATGRDLAVRVELCRQLCRAENILGREGTPEQRIHTWTAALELLAKCDPHADDETIVVTCARAVATKRPARIFDSEAKRAKRTR